MLCKILNRRQYAPLWMALILLAAGCATQNGAGPVQAQLNDGKTVTLKEQTPDSCPPWEIFVYNLCELAGELLPGLTR